jgi:hypothetical protein
MEKSKKTFNEIVEFNQEAFSFLRESKGETKLTYALKKLAGDPTIRKQGTLAKVIKKAQSKSRDLQIDYASTDEKTGVLLTDERGQYKYTKENKKALENALEELMDESLEFEPFIATEVAEGELNDYQKELFKGFVIN